MAECFSAWLCLFLGSSIDTPSRKQSCTTTNRMRESRSCGSVRAEGSNVLGYSEVTRKVLEQLPPTFGETARFRRGFAELACLAASRRFSVRILRPSWIGITTSRGHAIDHVRVTEVNVKAVSRRTVPPDPSPREHLLRAVLQFVKVVRAMPGVTRIALVGSLATEKSHPKDADVLVVIPDDVDLVPLATAGRRLKGTAQQRNCGADIFIANPAKEYRGRICHWRECRPGLRMSCDARHCGQRTHLHDDLGDVTLQVTLIRNPPLEVWPVIVRRCAVPRDVEELLLRPLASIL
jgi:hypothetical protein